jgi:addiction module HigA family antidote
MFIGFLFTVMLLPQLYDAYRGHSIMNLWTCLVTGLGCIFIGLIDTTINLPLAAVVSVSTGVMWLLLMYYSEKNKEQERKERIAVSSITPSPPGDTIQDLMDEWGYTNEELARRLGYPTDHLVHLLNGRVPLTDDMAEALSRVLGSSKEFWLNRELIYRKAMRGENDRKC